MRPLHRTRQKTMLGYASRHTAREETARHHTYSALAGMALHDDCRRTTRQAGKKRTPAKGAKNSLQRDQHSCLLRQQLATALEGQQLTTKPTRERQGGSGKGRLVCGHQQSCSAGKAHAQVGVCQA